MSSPGSSLEIAFHAGLSFGATAQMVRAYHPKESLCEISQTGLETYGNVHDSIVHKKSRIC